MCEVWRVLGHGPGLVRIKLAMCPQVRICTLARAEPVLCGDDPEYLTVPPGKGPTAEAKLMSLDASMLAPGADFAVLHQKTMTTVSAFLDIWATATEIWQT